MTEANTNARKFEQTSTTTLVLLDLLTKLDDFGSGCDEWNELCKVLAEVAETLLMDAEEVVYFYLLRDAAPAFGSGWLQNMR